MSQTPTVAALLAVPKIKFPGNPPAIDTSTLRLTSFGSDGPLIYPLGGVRSEVWSVSEVRHHVRGNAQISLSGYLNSTRLSFAADTELEEVAYHAYKSLFQITNELKLGQPVKIWNYIPHLLASDLPTSGVEIERYRQFNAGRRQAWEETGPRLRGALAFPAATVAGSFGGPLIIDAFTSTHPVQYIDNPRQTPAYHYSADYGSASPSFSRGALHLLPDRTEIFVSGTASIVGQETKHVGDVEAQTRETLANIAALVSGVGMDLRHLRSLRVYLRDSQDYELVRAIIEQTLPLASAIYLHEEICRPELLVEIEAWGYHQTP